MPSMAMDFMRLPSRRVIQATSRLTRDISWFILASLRPILFSSCNILAPNIHLQSETYQLCCQGQAVHDVSVLSYLLVVLTNKVLKPGPQPISHLSEIVQSCLATRDFGCNGKAKIRTVKLTNMIDHLAELGLPVLQPDS